MFECNFHKRKACWQQVHKTDSVWELGQENTIICQLAIQEKKRKKTQSGRENPGWNQRWTLSSAFHQNSDTAFESCPVSDTIALIFPPSFSLFFYLLFFLWKCVRFLLYSALLLQSLSMHISKEVSRNSHIMKSNSLIRKNYTHLNHKHAPMIPKGLDSSTFCLKMFLSYNDFKGDLLCHFLQDNSLMSR